MATDWRVDQPGTNSSLKLMSNYFLLSTLHIQDHVLCQRERTHRCSAATSIVWCLIALVMASGIALGDKASDDFNLGVGFYRSQRWEQASETFKLFLKEFPEHPRSNLARLYYALSLSSLEKYAPAREEFTAFIAAEPEGKNASDARYRLGECSYYLRDYPAAIEQLSGFLERHTEHQLADWAKLFLGDSYTATEQFAKAEQYLAPLVQGQTNPSIVGDARLSLGKALHGLKRTPEAIDQYRAVAALPDSALAPRGLYRIAIIQMGAQQYKDAAATYEELITSYPKSSLSVTAAFGAGRALFELGEFDKAIARFKSVPKESPNSVQSILMTAVSLKQLGKVEESRRFFADAIRSAGTTPLAAEIVFEQAQMERTADARETAAKLFEDLSDRWPNSPRMPDSLFNAAELRLDLGNREQAERLWRRLKTEFPENAAKPREQILLGRIFAARGEHDKAIETIQAAIKDPNSATTRSTTVGRYYLVRSLFESKKHDQVVEQASLMADSLKDDSLGEMRGALAMAAISSLELKEYDDAIKFADEFLPDSKDAKQSADVTAARSVALSHLKRFPEAIDSLKLLAVSNPDDAQTWTAILKSAEAALELESPEDAEALFKLASGYDKDPAVKEAGFAGIAWSQFKAKKFADAMKAFAKLEVDYPASEDLSQTLFMQARCAEELGDAEPTMSAYKMVFEKLTKGLQTPAPVGAESTEPLKFAFDSGRQVARGLEKLKRFDDADTFYETLVTQFSNAKDLDRLLDEWAWMNVSAERFERSDLIYRKLMDQFPDSPFAGQARLSLAESDLEAGRIDAALQEMEAIVADTRYGAAEKERALFHVIEIQSAARKWPAASAATEQFLASYASSTLSPQVRLFAGDALVQLGKSEDAAKALDELRQEIVGGKVRNEDWVDRVWVVLAEASLAAKKYNQIDILETELLERSKESRFGFQMSFVQGRRWKTQAPPDFEKSRKYLSSVTADALGQGTETAAQSQFLIAETLRTESRLDDATREYFKVYINYKYDDLRVRGLFQAAACEAQLQKTEAAVRDFKEVIAVFPKSEFSAMAREELKKLGVALD